MTWMKELQEARRLIEKGLAEAAAACDFPVSSPEGKKLSEEYAEKWGLESETVRMWIRWYHEFEWKQSVFIYSVEETRIAGVMQCFGAKFSANELPPGSLPIGIFTTKQGGILVLPDNFSINTMQQLFLENIISHALISLQAWTATPEQLLSGKLVQFS